MNKMVFKSAAKKWTEAIPVGNGRTGVMVYGGARLEKLTVNDCTLWSGYPKNQDNPESLRNLGKVRELIYAKKFAEAERLCESKMTGAYSESFLPLASVTIKLSGGGGHYERALDLDGAVCIISTDKCRRECFASYPDNVVCYKIKTERPRNIVVKASSKLKSEVIADDGIGIVGNAPDYVAPKYLMNEKNPVVYGEGKGMAFAMRIIAVSDGTQTAENGALNISGATETVLYMTTKTGYLGYDKMPSTDREAVFSDCKARLNKLSKNYDFIKEKHIADYKSLNDRQSLILAADKGATVKELLKRAKRGDVTAELSEIMYRFGKYLMIAGSRRGGEALTLQGIWNKDLRPAWSSNYTVNINTEMNYWCASTCNLSECLEPFFRFVGEIKEHGKSTAKVNYGCDGFSCNHNADIWRKTAPVKGDSNYMYAPLCGVWLTNEIYAHYKNGGLSEYEETVRDAVTEAAKFLIGYLVDRNGVAEVCPSTSPEIRFCYDNCTSGVGYATAFDTALVKQLFENYLEIDDRSDFAQIVKDKLNRLTPFKKGKTGMAEWGGDYPVNEKGHRHFSPLYGMYPGRVIKYYSDENERESVKELFESRLENSKNYIGWSAAWGICLAGRLHDAKAAEKIIKSLFKNSVFPNLFDAHFPFIFQIDGNFGYVAGVNETLVYTENGVIDFLPALPKGWEKGEAKGFVSDGAEIDFSWEGGKVTRVKSTVPVVVFKNNLSENCVLENATVVDGAENKG